LKKIFIDVGSGDCTDIKNFRKKNKGFIYYAIDPSSNYLEKWDKLKKQISKIYFINKAAWITDGKVTFYEQRNDNPQGSTIVKEKQRVESMFETIVEGFDFSEWLKQFKDDYVIINMDIEGAEYDVLSKMIDDGTITIPKRIYYENHAHKIYNPRYIELARVVEEKMNKLGVKFNL